MTLKPIWDALFKLQGHTGKLLSVPLVLSTASFVVELLKDITDDGVLDDTEFHALFQGANSLQMVILVLVMALLKAKQPPKA